MASVSRRSLLPGDGQPDKAPRTLSLRYFTIDTGRRYFTTVTETLLIDIAPHAQPIAVASQFFSHSKRSPPLVKFKVPRIPPPSAHLTCIGSPAHPPDNAFPCFALL
ncbi:hypothetical protein Tcan_00855, partial [Toxocara canis]